MVPSHWCRVHFPFASLEHALPVPATPQCLCVLHCRLDRFKSSPRTFYVLNFFRYPLRCILLSPPPPNRSFLFQSKITINTSNPQQLPMSVTLGKIVRGRCGTRFRKISRLWSPSSTRAVESFKCLEPLWDRNRKLRSGRGGDNSIEDTTFSIEMRDIKAISSPGHVSLSFPISTWRQEC